MIFSMMKKLKLTLLLALCAFALAGCEDTAHIGAGFGDRLITMEHNGHSYIVYKGVERGGIIHDPDCPCHKTNSER